MNTFFLLQNSSFVNLAFVVPVTQISGLPEDYFANELAKSLGGKQNWKITKVIAVADDNKHFFNAITYLEGEFGCWGIFTPENNLYPNSIRNTREMAIEDLPIDKFKWDRLQDEGWSCKPVQVFSH